MGQGSTPSGGEGAQGGGMGLGLLGSLFGGGSQSQQGYAAGQAARADLGQPVMYGGNPGSGFSDPSMGGGSQQGLLSRLGQILQDPEVLKALGDTTKHLGNTIAAGNKIPGHAAAMLQQAMGGQSPQVSQTAGSGPFVGDIPNFSPEQAQTILQAMGIPGGFTPLERR